MNSVNTGSKPFANMRSKAPDDNAIDTVATNIKNAVDNKSVKSSSKKQKQSPVSYYADPDIIEALRRKKEEEGIPVNNFINRVLRKELGL